MSLSTGRGSHSVGSTKAANRLELSKEGVQGYSPIDLMHKLAHASRSIHIVDTTLQPLYSRSDDLTILLGDSSASLRSLTCLPEFLTVSGIEQSYTTTSKNMLFTQQLDTESSILNKVDTYNIALSFTNLNTQNALRGAKQDR